MAEGAHGGGAGTNGTRRVNLLAMGADVAVVTIEGADGQPRDVGVRPITGRAWHRLATMKPEERAVGMYEVARLCLRDVTEEEVLNLTPAQVNRVVELATDGLGGDGSGAAPAGAGGDPNAAGPVAAASAPA